jgi:protein-S-isoprenylcysteine O-methyltransferase Ste14
MAVLTRSIVIVWLVFWVYWMISALAAKRGSRTARARLPGLLILIAVFLLVHVLKISGLSVHNLAIQALGTALLLSGLGLAVWARVYLGRNWGMPMTQKNEPELVTSGPYRFVRHPIYSGLLLAMLGTSLATTLFLLVVLCVMGVYFIYSAKVEEGLLSATFPAAYPSYRMETKMLIPFVL